MKIKLEGYHINLCYTFFVIIVALTFYKTLYTIIIIFILIHIVIIEEIFINNYSSLRVNSFEYIFY